MTTARLRFLALLDRVLIAVAITGLILAVVALATAGFSFRILELRISVHSALRPFAIALAALAVACAIDENRATQMASLWRVLEGHARSIAILAAVAAVVIGLRLGTFTAGGSDSYGYVSEAGLWLSGHLVTAQPIAVSAPWPGADWTFTPLAYRPGATPGTILPTVAPGLPLVMAVFLALFGSQGVFLVVPVFGALAVWLTFVLGRRIDGAPTAAAAAILLVCSPAFLFQVVAPMSDVPATAWWLLSLVLVTGTTSITLFAGGLAASAALLTRPNLLPLALVLAGFIVIAAETPRSRKLVSFALGLAPGCLAIAAINTVLYGSPLESGYGGVSTLFSMNGLVANLVRYPRWLLETQTPFVCLAAAAPWLVRRRELAWLFLAFFAALFACYVFYMPFDSWLFVRFLLPAIPLLLILSASVALALLRRLRWSWQGLAMVAMVTLIGAWTWNIAVNRGLFLQRLGERRFVDVGAFVRESLPPQSAMLALMHSGSIRHYAARLTLRWDMLPPESLDAAMAFLRSNGYVPYIVLDSWEQPEFRARFQGHSDLAALDWPPMAESKAPAATRIYDPNDRARFKAGQTVTTRTITSRP